MPSPPDLYRRWRYGRDPIKDLFEGLSLDGVVWLDRFESRSDVVKFAQGLGAIVDHPHANRAGVTLIEPTGRRRTSPGGRGFTKLPLFPHTDRTTIKRPPSLVIHVLERPSRSGGEALIADGQRLVELLRRNGRSRLETLQRAGGIAFTSGSDILVDSVLMRLRSQRLRIKFRNDDGIYLQPELTNAFVECTELIKRTMKRVRLSAGQGYVADNWRILHGRTGFRGFRTALRVLVDADRKLENTLGIKL